MVEKVTAVPHGQQCLEKTRSISLSWLQTFSWRSPKAQESAEARGSSALPSLQQLSSRVGIPVSQRLLQPSQGRTHSHLQLSKEAPTTHPGLAVPPQQDRGSDALAPWEQQDTNTHEVNKNLLARGTSASATQLQGPVPQPRMVGTCPARLLP